VNWLAWSLLSACFAAATAILAKLGVEGVDSNFATAVRTSVIVVFTWIIAYATSGRQTFRTHSSRTWVFLCLSGLATGLSWLCYFRALQLGEASRVAPIDKLSVVLVILSSTLFLGERLTAGKTIGGVLIAAGAIAVALD
jgi:transporter family protein